MGAPSHRRPRLARRPRSDLSLSIGQITALTSPRGRPLPHRWGSSTTCRADVAQAPVLHVRATQRKVQGKCPSGCLGSARCLQALRPHACWSAWPPGVPKLMACRRGRRESHGTRSVIEAACAGPGAGPRPRRTAVTPLPDSDALSRPLSAAGHCTAYALLQRWSRRAPAEDTQRSGKVTCGRRTHYIRAANVPPR